MHRFCSKFSMKNGSRICSEMLPNRPFNGRNLDTLRTPWCEAWSKGKSIVCSEISTVSGVPKCTELTLQQKHDGPFYCSKVRDITPEKGGCTSIADSTDIFDKREREYLPNEIFQEARLPKKESIVKSLYCEEFRKGI